jgi:hypothetical protein
MAVAEHIIARSISEAWVKAIEYLLSQHGKASNLILSIQPDGIKEDDSSVRHIFDGFLKKHTSKRVRSIRKVADTIFPIDFYTWKPGKEAREHLYDMQTQANEMERRTNPRGQYIDRLICWPGRRADGKNGQPYQLGLSSSLSLHPKHASANDREERNQLESLITRMRKRLGSGKKNGSEYELAVAVPFEASDSKGSSTEDGDLRIQDPLSDHFIMGFPCLSHISLTLFNGSLNMTALYRNQHFITKAYGNLVGLSDLLRFIAAEVGCSIGELVCVATHADAELGQNGIKKSEIEMLVHECRAALDDTTEQW